MPSTGFSLNQPLPNDRKSFSKVYLPKFAKDLDPTLPIYLALFVSVLRNPTEEKLKKKPEKHKIKTKSNPS